MRLQPKYHRYLYLSGLLLLAIGLPLGHAFMSIGQIVLVANWIWEGNYRHKFRSIGQSAPMLVFCSIFLLHIVGLAWTHDFDFALKDLRIKLPLLILPLILVSSAVLTRNELRAILFVFIGAVTTATMISTAIWLGFTEHEVSDQRDISIFVSHIRFSLLICLSVFFLLRLMFNHRESVHLRFTGSVVTIWLVLFLFILEAFTGIVIWLAVGYLLVFMYVWRSKVRWAQWAFSPLLAGIPIVVIILSINYVAAFQQVADPSVEQLETHSAQGNRYWHSDKRHHLENGYHVYWYVASKELGEAWNERSEMPISGTDLTGNNLEATLMRFLTSKGLHKDRAGVKRLSMAEIHAIEQGTANVRYLENNGISNRLYALTWEVHYLLLGENPEGNSATQRWEFWKTGWWIVKQNPIFGVGTGDTKEAFATAYEQLDSPLAPEFRLRAHNQFLTMLLTFGPIGLIWFLVALVWPAVKTRKFNDFFFFVTFLVGMLSMLTEDTLETQAGVTWFAFFYCLFMFAQGDGEEAL